MPDYSKSKIYKIVCNETGETYYGSTTVPLSQRIGKHRLYTGCSSWCIIERGNYDYSLIEEFPCESKEQLHKRERWYIENNDCVNARVAGRTQKEYRQDNKEKILERERLYRQANKDKIAEGNRQYRVDNRDKLADKKAEYYYKEGNHEKLLDYSRNYYYENKESVLKRTKEYRESNKDKIAEKKSKKITCECGCIIRKNDIGRHRKSKKHERLIKELSSPQFIIADS